MGYAFTPARRLIQRRLVGVALAVAAASISTLGFGSPASAQVGVGAAGGAIQGDTAELVFTITNDAAATTITLIEIQMPQDTPIAEVYPMSVDNWAPSITMRSLSTPLPGIHGPKITDTPASVTYQPMPGQELAAGATVTLRLSAGPLPEVKRLVFGVVQTNSDGSVIRWTRQPAATGTAAADERPAPVLAVDPAATDPGAGQPAEAPAASAGPTGGGDSTAWWVFAAFVVIGGLTVFGLARQRRPRQRVLENSPESSDDDSELPSADTPEIASDDVSAVTAGAGKKS
jgi:uncharacterized protein YcnI